MNQLTDRQRRILATSLSAFTAAARARKVRRRMGRGVAMFAIAVVAAVAVNRTLRPSAPRLPAYVEVIVGDAQLREELQLASACERIERTGGRLQVVECVAMAPRR